MVQAREELQELIARVSRYPLAKDSGIPWAGKVPGHWRVVRQSGRDERDKSGWSYGRKWVTA